MSSIVSRRPPVFGSVSHSKDLRWMAIKFGRSRTFSREANSLRWRGASTRAKKRLLYKVGGLKNFRKGLGEGQPKWRNRLGYHSRSTLGSAVSLCRAKSA